jgi:hypothetical protein
MRLNDFRLESLQFREREATSKDSKLLGFVRLLDVLDGQDITSGLWVVLKTEPLVVDEQGWAGGDGERLALAPEPHPQDRVLLAVLDGARQLDIAA